MPPAASLTRWARAHMGEPHWSPEEVVQAFEEVVNERGEDYTYPEKWRTEFGGCKYSHKGKPACIVGAAFEKLTGAVIPEKYSNQSALYVTDYLFPSRPIELDTLVSAICGAQCVQDQGGTWGDALEKIKDSQ